MRLIRLLSVCLASWLALSAPAGAQALSADQILDQFNAVIFGNLTTSADIEGRTVVGGNLTGGNTFALNPVSEAASTFSALTVYGSVTGTGSYNVDNAAGAVIAGSNAGNFQFNDGGSVYIGAANTGNITTDSGSTNLSINGNNSGSLTVNGGGTVKINGNAGSGTLNGGSLTYTGSIGSWNLNGGATATKVSSLSLSSPLPSFASTFEAPLTGLSSQLAAMTANSTVLVSGNTITLNAEPGANGVAVLDLSTAQLTANSNVTVALNGATSLIVNLAVAGCSSNCTYSFPSNVTFLNPTSYADSVLWNITDVSNLSFTNEFGGTVLAPDATVMNNSSIDGTLVALNYDGSGELHAYPFNGIPTPEPPGIAVLGVAIVGITAFRRRGRVTAARRPG